MAVLYTQHFVQFFDNNGNPLSNGKLFAYSAGTTTPKATYTTEEATVQNNHPVVLDAAGRATVFIEGSYRFDLFDENDVLIKSTDDVTSFTALNETGDPFFQTFSGTGSQTVFTLSESLGDDSKDIMVYVNAGGTEGYDIQTPSAYTLSGTALTFNSAPASGTGNIYVFAPTKLLGAAAASAAAAAASETSAAASANEAQAAAGLLEITSTSSITIGTGLQTFTVDEDLGVEAGQWVIIVSDASPTTNYMTGQVTSYVSTNLQVNVTQAFGSGTLNDWTFFLSGVEGEAGPAGGISGGTLSGNISGDSSTYKLVDMADPTNPQDYVTKAYSDNIPVSRLADATAGELITWDSGGVATTVSAGTSGQVLTSNGAGAEPTYQDASGGGFKSQQIFTSSGTWNRPSGITLIRVRVWGGGGAGGDSGSGTDHVCGGGGAGGYSEEVIDVSLITSVSVTVGSSSTGDGNSSSFGGFCSATGGTRGTNTTTTEDSSAGGAGGSGSGGDINLTGQAGFYGQNPTGSVNAVANTSGAGGSTTVGAGGQGARASGANNNNGNAGNGYGSGGSGAAKGPTAAPTSRSGGNGAQGLVIVEEFE